MLGARMRTDAGWSDACILNISSRGLLVHSLRAPAEGSTLELHHRDCAIVARVVWRKGAKAGLQAEDRIAVEQILTLGNCDSLRLNSAGAVIERRKVPRISQESRTRGRIIEFAGVATIAATLALGGLVMMETALAKPLAAVGAALGG